MADSSTKVAPTPLEIWEPGSASNKGRRYTWQATLFLICAAAFTLAALVSLGILERVPHVEDEAAYLFQAQVFAIGRLSVPTPPYPESYWSPFVLDHQGQRFGKYPPGYPLLLSLGVRAGTPWIINALLGSLGLWSIAYLGREIYSPTTGLLAAALGLSCPVFLAESASLLSHPTSLFFTALFLWAFARILRETGGQRQYAALAGLALGWLIITRPYDAIGVGLPFALYGLARGLRGDRTMLTRGIIAASIALLFGVILSAYWYWLIRDFVNPYGLVWPYDRPGFGPNIGLKGYTLATGLSYVRYNLNALASGFLGWPSYLNIIFLWLPFVFRPRDRWNYLLLAGFASVVNLHLTYWYYGGHDAGYPRYYYAALPMLLLLTARGIEVLSLALQRLSYRARRFFEQGASRMIPPLARLAVYLILIALTLYNGLFSLPMRLSPFQGKSGITAAPLQVVRDAGMTNVLVFVADYEYWFDFAVFFSANSPTLDSDVVYAIYQNEQQARGVTGLYPHRRCYVQRQNRLLPCPF